MTDKTAVEIECDRIINTKRLIICAVLILIDIIQIAGAIK